MVGIARVSIHKIVSLHSVAIVAVVYNLQNSTSILPCRIRSNHLSLFFNVERQLNMDEDNIFRNRRLHESGYHEISNFIAPSSVVTSPMKTQEGAPTSESFETKGKSVKHLHFETVEASELHNLCSEDNDNDLESQQPGSHLRERRKSGEGTGTSK